MIKSRLLATAALAFAATAPAHAANLVADGSFESGFGAWTVVGGSGAPNDTAPVVINYGSNDGYPTGAFGEPIGANGQGGYSPDAAGSKVAYFSSDVAGANSPQYLSQMVNLTKDTYYRIGFDFYAPANGINNPNDATLSFSLDGTGIGKTLQAGSVSGTPAQMWDTFATSFKATADGPQLLKFDFSANGITAADFAIDRVYLIAGGVPEPSTWAMMIIGFGLIGAGMRRKQNQTVRYGFA